MRITPLDVRKQEFRKGMRGLDPEEVYAFLATVADEYEMVLNDNKALRERLLELDDKVQEYRSMEKTLRDTLLTAERVNVEAKDNARREANIIVKEAQIEAEKALRDIRTEAMKLRNQVQQLRGQRDSFLSRMKVVAESHLNYIQSAVKDFHREDVDVDGHVDEEYLADRGVEHDDVAVLDAPARSIDAARDRADTAAPRPVPTPAPRTQATAPASTPTATPSLAPAATNTPSATLSQGSSSPVATATPPATSAPVAPSAPTPAPQAAPAPRATEAGNDGIDPITMIIDRMKRGQQEVLAAGSGAPGIPGAPTEPRPVSQPAPQQRNERRTETRDVVARESETLDLDALEEDAVAVAPVARGDARTGNGNDVTRELHLDDIRREIAGRENQES